MSAAPTAVQEGVGNRVSVLSAWEVLFPEQSQCPPSALPACSGLSVCPKLEQVRRSICLKARGGGTEVPA